VRFAGSGLDCNIEIDMNHEEEELRRRMERRRKRKST
jgi:hypothetical protein